MKNLISQIASIIIICFTVNQLQAQDGYTYSLVDNGGFSYTITAVPNASTNNFATSVQSYGFTIIVPDGVTAVITSSLGNGAGATFFDGSAVGQATIDGYLITETLGSPVSLSAPANGIATPMVTLELQPTPIEAGTISILANDSALATAVTPLKSFMAADMIDNGAAVFPNVVDSNGSGLSGTTSHDYDPLSTIDNVVLDFSIYPNPTTDNIYINQVQNLIKVEVINMNGQLILTKNNNLEKIDVSRLQNGMYFLKIFTENGSNSKKFIKK